MLKEKQNNTILYFALILYLILLIWVVIFKLGIPNIILEYGSITEPYSIGPKAMEYLNFTHRQKVISIFTNLPRVNIHGFLDVFTNIVVFMPLGLLIPTLTKKHKGIVTILSGLFISCIVEIFQFYTLFGRCDMFDVIFNTLGTFFGLLINMFVVKKVQTDKISFIINIVGIVAIIVELIILIYAVFSVVKASDVIFFKWYEVQKYMKL